MAKVSEGKPTTTDYVVLSDKKHHSIDMSGAEWPTDIVTNRGPRPTLPVYGPDHRALVILRAEEPEEPLDPLSPERLSAEDISFIQLPPSLWQKCGRAARYGGVAIGAIGVGVGMMPIFNDDIRALDDEASPVQIHVHASQALFVLSTLNTLVTYTTMSAWQIIKALSSEALPRDLPTWQSAALRTGKLFSICSSILPISLLWNIELNNQTKSNSSGIDKFTCWAMAGSCALFFAKTLTTNYNITNFILSRFPSKQNIPQLLLTGATILTSMPARYGSYLYCLRSLPIGVNYIGAIGATAVTAISDFNGMRSVIRQDSEPTTARHILLPVVVAQSIWFSLPKAIVSYTATTSWNSTFRAVTTVAWVASSSITIGKKIFDTFNLCRKTR